MRVAACNRPASTGSAIICCADVLEDPRPAVLRGLATAGAGTG